MYKHHEEAIERVRVHFAADEEVVGVLLGGSLAHGTATEASDVDLMRGVSDADYERRQAEGRIHFYSHDLTTYEGGYVDGKYTSHAFIRQVVEAGNEPRRYAFKDARVLLDRTGGLERLARDAARFPEEGVAERVGGFYAQLEGWRWYTNEALRHGNLHLLGWSVHRLVLFGGRMILAHNRLLFPYHKWFLRVLEEAADKPRGLMDAIDALHHQPSRENVESFFGLVRDFRTWEVPEHGWPARFMADTELNWQHGPVGIEDW